MMGKCWDTNCTNLSDIFMHGKTAHGLQVLGKIRHHLEHVEMLFDESCERIVRAFSRGVLQRRDATGMTRWSSYMDLVNVTAHA